MHIFARVVVFLAIVFMMVVASAQPSQDYAYPRVVDRKAPCFIQVAPDAYVRLREVTMIDLGSSSMVYHTSKAAASVKFTRDLDFRATVAKSVELVVACEVSIGSK